MQNRPQQQNRPPLFGEAIPHFACSSSASNPFHFSQLGGRYILMAAYGSASMPLAQEALNAVLKAKKSFSTDKVFVGISGDPADQENETIKEICKFGIFMWDFDHSAKKNLGLIQKAEGNTMSMNAVWIMIDPQLRVMQVWSLNESKAALAAFKKLGKPEMHAGLEIHAPVLIIPRVFEPEFCKTLIDYYNQKGGEISGFMKEQDGITLGSYDSRHKSRRDCNIEDDVLMGAARARVLHRLVPEIKRAYQFQVTRMERYIVACYDANEEGHFRRHRDNTTKGTAHRRFAVTINLNADEYQGGDLTFPEFGTRTYRAPTGGAVVFSCSLLHEANKVTKGKRYAFLPFLYDDAAAKIREENLRFLVAENGGLISKSA